MVITTDWKDLLETEFSKEYFLNLKSFLKEENKSYKIFPPKDEIFSALNMCSLKDTKVLILGQDPYHGEGQGHGLAFSVKEGVKLPPSLRNMYKEIENEMDITMSKSGYLKPWADQGILLLNTVLTVREGEANSHKNKGWEVFTDEIIKILNEKTEPVIFILWGGNAKLKKKLITNPYHFILEGAHPSPLSAYRGFFGCNHFKEVNNILSSLKEKNIDWKI